MSCPFCVSRPPGVQLHVTPLIPRKYDPDYPLPQRFSFSHLDIVNRIIIPKLEFHEATIETVLDQLRLRVSEIITDDPPTWVPPPKYKAEDLVSFSGKSDQNSDPLQIETEEPLFSNEAIEPDTEFLFNNPEPQSIGVEPNGIKVTMTAYRIPFLHAFRYTFYSMGMDVKLQRDGFSTTYPIKVPIGRTKWGVISPGMEYALKKRTDPLKSIKVPDSYSLKQFTLQDACDQLQLMVQKVNPEADPHTLIVFNSKTVGARKPPKYDFEITATNLKDALVQMGEQSEHNVILQPHAVVFVPWGIQLTGKGSLLLR